MPRPRLRTVTLDEVKITRDGDFAIFRYRDPSMGGWMNIKVGQKVKKMTLGELHKTPKIKVSAGKRERSRD